VTRSAFSLLISLAAHKFVNLISGDELGPGFAYSFGLYEEFGHPEIIIFGLAAESMHHVHCSEDHEVAP
jgi:hypothetical protein